MQQELEAEGPLWGPLRGELFGSDVQRATAAIDAYSKTFNGTAGPSRF